MENTNPRIKMLLPLKKDYLIIMCYNLSIEPTGTKKQMVDRIVEAEIKRDQHNWDMIAGA